MFFAVDEARLASASDTRNQTRPGDFEEAVVEHVGEVNAFVRGKGDVLRRNSHKLQLVGICARRVQEPNLRIVEDGRDGVIVGVDADDALVVLVHDEHVRGVIHSNTSWALKIFHWQCGLCRDPAGRSRFGR